MRYIGLHFQTEIDGWLDEIIRAANAGRPYRVVKSFWVEAGKIVKGVSPQTITVFRQFIAHQQPYLDQAIISPAQADAAADAFILQFKDAVNQHGGLDYVESLNETIPTGDILAQQKAVAFDRAFVRRLKVHCPNVGAIVYTAPSGNINHNEYEILVPLAQEVQAAGGAFGPHGYWSVVKGKSYVSSAQHAYDFHMRWANSLDAFLVARGIEVKYLLGEVAPIGADPNGYNQRPDDGWQHPEVWNGYQDGYLADLVAFDAMCAASVPAQDNRLLGATLFTSGIGVGWNHFQVQRPFLSRVTDFIISDPSPPPPVPPPPVPPPADRVLGVDVSHHQQTMNWDTCWGQGARFALIRASNGLFADQKYTEHWQGAGSRGFLRGPWHFYREDAPLQEQIDFFYDLTRDAKEIKPGLDVEIYIHYPIPTADRVFAAVQLIEQKFGVRPILYTNLQWLSYVPLDHPLRGYCDLWLAAWTTATNPIIPAGWDRWVIWQFGKKPGYLFGASSSEIDVNRFNGTEADLAAYAGFPPVPSEENFLRNPSFEGGHYVFTHPNGTVYDNILVPNEWWFRFAGSNVPNEYNSDPENVYQQPEMMPMHRSQIPDDEEGDFFWDGDFTLKLFSEHRAWRTKLIQALSEVYSGGKLTINLFVDCYTAVVNGQKVWATDPNTCLVVPEINGQEWGPRVPLAPGHGHTVTWEIDAEIETAGLKIIAPFATKNNGVFMDAFRLTRPTEPFPVYASKVSLLPPVLSAGELQEVLTFVSERKETLAWSPHDCVKLVSSGQPGTVNVWWADRWPVNIVTWLQSYGVQHIVFLP